jgi:DNA (cytosine-5)-methyltransferase 1
MSLIVWENVPGVLSSNGGKDFGTFLGGLGELGYGFAYRVLDAQYFGVAQRRRRVFVVGYLGDWRRAAAVLFERHSLSGDSAPRRQKGESVTASIRTGIESSLDCGVELTGPLSARDYKDAGTDGMNKNSAKMIPVTKAWPAEITSSLCASDGPKGVSDQYAHEGKLIAMAHGQGGAEIGIDRCPTLTCVHEAPIAAYFPTQPIALAENTIGRQPENGGNGDGFTDGGPMYTLNATGVHGVAQPISFDMAQITSKVNGTRVEPGLPISTMAKGSQMHVALSVYENHPADSRVQEMGEVCSTVTSRWGTGGGNLPMVGAVGTDLYNGAITGEVAATMTKSMSGTGTGPTAMQQMAVRRLTPIECERLQGFGDNYTDIMPRGKPTPDGPRYKALGNSMAVPVMAWIGKRIQEVENL